jgi:plasmid stability protein
MPSLLIRNVDQGLHARLKARAAAHRRSLEEEVRETLRAAVARAENPPRERFGDLAQRLFAPSGGLDFPMPPRGSEPDRAPPDFSGPEYDPQGWR